MKLDKKGFTVIELILSFVLVMFLSMGMFTLVTNYKNREQKESVKRELLALENALVQDIYQDTIERKVDNIKNCTDASGQIVKQCIDIKFLDGTEKQLKVEQTDIEVTEEGTKFEYTTFTILYGGVKYNNPDPKFTKIVSDYILTSSIPDDNLEYGVIYHIKIRIKNQDIKEEYVVDVVTTGLR
ncbi:MAG: type II secretion system protein [Bacilli bacterium]|nr:type II secretion system protein [Bacilli bacterium]